MIPEITEAEMESLTRSILTRHGIDFTSYEPKSLRRRIIRVMNLRNMLSVHDLWVQFLRDPKFINIFMNEISVGMTSMFRDPSLWKCLKNIIRTELKDKPTINVWHSGCSTGEEVYSMGILLDELNLSLKAKALATDINMNALQEAKDGVYHKVKMIENQNNFTTYNSHADFSRYYKKEDSHITMQSRLINHVTFRYHNLVTDPFPAGFDIIFCRNVMIYFDGHAKKRIIDLFYEALNPGGYFILGYFDTLVNLVDNKSFSVVDGETRIFKKS